MADDIEKEGDLEGCQSPKEIEPQPSAGIFCPLNLNQAAANYVYKE